MTPKIRLEKINELLCVGVMRLIVAKKSDAAAPPANTAKQMKQLTKSAAGDKE